MPEPLSKTGVCLNCKVTRPAVLHKHIRSNGAEGFMWMCSVCNKRAPFGGALFIANDQVKAYLTPEQIDALPILCEPPFLRCVKCGKRGAELHHWAPRAIFGKDEAEQWPQDYLCKECHDKWHEMVTPQLVRKAHV